MLTSIEGIYENGVVRLLEPLPGVTRARVVVTVLPETLSPLSPDGALPPANGHKETEEEAPVMPLTDDSVVDQYQPRTELGRKLIELRRAYLASGGKCLTQDEILAEVRRRRGEVVDD